MYILAQAAASAGTSCSFSEIRGSRRRLTVFRKHRLLLLDSHIKFSD